MARSDVITLFEEVRRSFPHLEMVVEQTDPHVDLNMEIPKQPGLRFKMNLNLQGDELHMSVGAFWLEWFPCDRPEVVSQFRDAVLGIVSGRYRIVEYYRGSRAVRADLQQPDGTGWRTIGSWGRLHLTFPWQRTRRVLQNQEGLDVG
jgi:hypothetical protein